MLRKIRLSIFFIPFVLLSILSCSNVEQPQEPIDYGYLELTARDFSKPMTYDDFGSIWNFETQTKTQICDARIHSEEYYKILYEFDSILETGDGENFPTKIGEFDSIKISLFHDPDYFLDIREIYVSDVNYGKYLTRFSNKRNYKKINSVKDENLLKCWVGNIYFDEGCFTVDSSGYIVYKDKNDVEYISKETLNIYDFLGYCFCNHAFYRSDYSSYGNVAPDTREGNYVLLTKQEKNVILSGSEYFELLKTMGFSNKRSNNSNPLTSEFYEGSDKLNNHFSYGESILVQKFYVDEEGNERYSDSTYNFIDKNGIYCEFGNRLSFGNVYLDNFAVGFYNPYLMIYDFVFDYETLNELFK